MRVAGAGAGDNTGGSHSYLHGIRSSLGFEEKNKGSIEVGKLADLIVVSDDPLTVPSDKLKDINLVITIIDGKIVNSADSN